MEKADKKQLTSVALPALGTRYNNYLPRVSAAGVLKGIDQFSKSHTRSSVKIVVIVLYGGNQHEEILKVGMQVWMMVWGNIDVSLKVSIVNVIIKNINNDPIGFKSDHM